MLRSWDVTRALRHYRLGVQVSTGFMTSWGDLQDAIDLLVDIVRAGGALRIFRMRSSLASRTTVATWWSISGSSAQAPPHPRLSYTYRRDQELVQASQTAGAHCAKYGSQPMTSTMATNPDGRRTVTFQCGRVELALGQVRAGSTSVTEEWPIRSSAELRPSPSLIVSVSRRAGPGCCRNLNVRGLAPHKKRHRKASEHVGQ
jgi:hypothetical protein